MSIRSPFCIAGMVAVAVATSLGALSSNAAPWSPGGSQPGANQEESTCQPEYGQTASADTILLGETLAVTIAVRPGCPDELLPLHLVIVADGSESMVGTPNALLKAALVRFIGSLGLEQHPSTRVGIVQFGDRARTLCRLTNDRSIAVACANRIGANGGSAMDEGLLQAIEVLHAGRLLAGTDPIAEVILLLADGVNTRGCQPVLRAADQARDEGIVVVTVCIGPNCDETCLRQVADNRYNYYGIESAAGLYAVMDQARGRLEPAVLQLAIEEVLHPSMAYVAGSANPPTTDPAAPSYHLSWEDTIPVASVYTCTFGVRPMEVGTWPIGFAATGRIVDWRGRTREWAFESPSVTVLDAPTEPTGTSIAPEVTASAVPTEAATATPARQATVFLPSVRARGPVGDAPRR